jgi:hypothetical protein
LSGKVSKFASIFDAKRQDPLTTSLPDSPLVPTSDHQSPKKKAVAPERDFNRRANSLERDAMPAGLFPGSTFKIYNAIYLRTLGAITPRRTVRASRRDFLDWTDIRNLKTVDTHLRYLIAKGLLIRKWELGSNEGSEYEIVLPEELPRLTTTTHHSPPVPASQEMASGYTQEIGSGGQGQPIDSKAVSPTAKTSFNTKEGKTDDEPAALNRAAFELTGKRPSATEWSELFDLLASELKIAAARTTVSSVPAFLTEHLRRRLWKVDKVPVAGETAKTPPVEPIDASKCPDCGGGGVYYPDGYDKPVAKCKHIQLSKS